MRSNLVIITAFVKAVLVGSLVSTALAVAPGLQSGEKIPAFAIPRMAATPTIDGTIDPTEWREACAISGVVDQSNDTLIPRPTTFFLAWDAEHLYFASRTYLRPGYKPAIQDGRSQGVAYCYDDGLELMFRPRGKNVSAQNHQTAFKMFLNCLGFDGDLTRLALGQQLKNWSPRFKTAVRITPQGSAPNNGSWWELEASTSLSDFELTGPNQAGDQWQFMFGINQIPGWMQARIPCAIGYFVPEGKNVGTLVENIPAVQFTMDSLNNLATDGTAAMNVRAFNPSKDEAKLAVVIDVAGKIKKNETLIVPAGGEAKFDLAEKLPADVTTGEINVSVSLADKPLLTYTALFNVGQYNWMLKPVEAKDQNKFAFITNYNPVRNQLLIKGDSYYLPDPSTAKSLEYRVIPEGSTKPIVEGAISNTAEFYFQDVLPLSLQTGKYTVEAFLTLVDGKRLGPMTAAIEKKDEAKAFPEWWGRKFGNTERVIPPFTAITHQENVFNCWGRQYALNALGLPDAVKSQDETVLAAPARIVGMVNGKEEVIKLGPPKIVEVTDWRIRFEGTASGAGLEFAAKGTLEQDGFVYVELTYRPQGSKPVSVDALRIEYPLAKTDAGCLVCIGPGSNYSSKSTIVLPNDKQGDLWSTLDTGRTGSNMKVGSFYPAVWIGSERRGFLWWGDNDQGWFPDNDIPAHSVARTGSAVVLRNNIIGKPVTLENPRTIAFSYMASPFKPLPKGWRSVAATHDGTFSTPFRGVRTDSKTGQKLFDGVGNVNWIHPESRYSEEWSALWAEQKIEADAHYQPLRYTDPYESRMGVNFAHMSFQLLGYGHKSLEDAIFNYFGDEWFTGLLGDTWNETYIDYAMYLFDRAYREGGVRSTYWDLSFPIPCDSLLSGLAYRLPDGRVQQGYNDWNVRRFFMRLWSLAHDHGLNPGGIGCHSSNAYIFCSLGWIDAILDGEREWNLDTSDSDWVDYYPIERMRSMSCPHNWGVSINWMGILHSQNVEKIANAKRSQAEYLWMHDSWFNPTLTDAINPPAYYAIPREILRMPQAVLDWGMNGESVLYHPYWRNPYVTCQDKDILITLWRIPTEQRVVVGVYNYNRKLAKDAIIQIDLTKLGLTPQQAAALALYQPGGATAELDVSSGTLKLKALPPHRGMFVGLATPDVFEQERVAKSLPAWVVGGLPASVVNFGLARKETQSFAPGQAPGVSCEDTAIQVGMLQLPDRVLLAVYNADGAEVKNAVIKVDLDKLELMPKLPWQEFIGTRNLQAEEKASDALLDVPARTLSIKTLPPKTGRLVAIRRY
jgi:hypothetical protein